ncbi:MAG: hypothetical protein L6U99_13120 [Clostridium sp.]|nr:MAG: hypothetical protein L6U99_13120 [Clostridium sp.]
MFYPVSNKVQITNTHQTSIELDRTADYMFPNTIGFYGISNSVFLPYHYLASDRISGSSYDADTKKIPIIRIISGAVILKQFIKIQVDRKVDCVFLNNNADSINPKNIYN